MRVLDVDGREVRSAVKGERGLDRIAAVTPMHTPPKKH
jgi:hypothetical protein